MSGIRIARALAPGFLAIVSLHPRGALAQPPPDVLPPVVVTATRGPLEVSRVGGAVTIVDAADIEKSGASSLASALRAVPGLDAHEAGGVGSLSNVSLRGATPGQTLVLVDGNRVGDPTGTDGALDLGSLAVTDIERVEVLRGPQSALYGSDAMGGVVNIITRKGEPGIRRSASVEAGSYGTLHSRGSVSGATDKATYAFSVDMLHVDGFARYVDRARQRAGTWPAPPKSDPVNRVGASGRVSYRLSDSVEVETGFTASFNRLTFDNGFAFVPANVYDRFNVQKQWTGSLFARATADAFDGALKNKVTVFASSIDRAVAETESCPDFVSSCVSNYRGRRQGAEYQGDLKLGRFGLLAFGARSETESAVTSQDYPAGYAGAPFQGVSARQTTNSLFALHGFSPANNIDVSLGGRVDAVEGGKTFATWRATIAYRRPESGTKLRASAGTGARAPSLFQRFSQYGAPGLGTEYSTGFDAGIDQSLADGRVTLSGSVFLNRFRDLIDFGFPSGGCLPAQVFGCYYNVGRAVTQGAEIAASAILVPGTWRARASYTHLVARDEIARTRLLQKPRDKGVVSVVYTGVAGLELEGRATFVSSVLDYGSVKLARWARFDVLASHKINETLSAFGRLENIGNARYEEAFNFAVAGRAVYAGLKAAW